MDSKSTAGDSVPVRVRSPAPIKATENDTFSVAFIFSSVDGLESQVRVRGARGALPVADEATRASGNGRCATQPRHRQGAHRAPQQDTGTRKTPHLGLTGREVSLLEYRFMIVGSYILRKNCFS